MVETAAAAASRRARQRMATARFFGTHISLRDRLLCQTYFELTAETWRHLAADDRYLEPLRHALRECQPPARVLDIGVGTGPSAVLVGRCFPDADVCAIDTSTRMLRHARALVHDSAVTNVRLLRANAAALPFSAGQFDLVICMNSMPEPTEIQRVTAPGAELVVTSSFSVPYPNESAWTQRWESLGFDRSAGGPCGEGGWERYRRVRAARAPSQ